mmetsp:Transcript_7334/g.21947  ORF Transcript_7334/g.21947 Transcript_7334/m.21947 type:complete len:232 (+) Transcript_7334:857-1552(+)
MQASRGASRTTATCWPLSLRRRASRSRSSTSTRCSTPSATASSRRLAISFRAGCTASWRRRPTASSAQLARAASPRAASRCPPSRRAQSLCSTRRWPCSSGPSPSCRMTGRTRTPARRCAAPSRARRCAGTDAWPTSTFGTRATSRHAAGRSTSITRPRRARSLPSPSRTRSARAPSSSSSPTCATTSTSRTSRSRFRACFTRRPSRSRTGTPLASRAATCRWFRSPPPTA